MVLHVKAPALEKMTKESVDLHKTSKEGLDNANARLRIDLSVKIPFLQYSFQLKVCKIKAASREGIVMTDPSLLDVK